MHNFLNVRFKIIINARLFFLDSVKRPFQDYFTHIKTSQSVGGAKLSTPGKSPNTPQVELDLSHI